MISAEVPRYLSKSEFFSMNAIGDYEKSIRIETYHQTSLTRVSARSIRILSQQDSVTSPFNKSSKGIMGR
jgi:hypothetical protein